MSVIEKALDKVRRSAISGQPNVPETGLAPAMPGGAGRAQPATGVTTLEVAPASPARRITVSWQSLQDAGYVPEAGLERQFAGQYRQIKRRLIETAMSAGSGAPSMRAIVATSALPGDGKTFTSINLAFSIARERDLNVLLIDADVASPRISDVFGQKDSPGLLDALQDPSLDIESLVLGTDVPGLSLLPAGKWAENATEMLSSARMDRIVARLTANPRRIVLFDSPPLLVSTEAQVLLKNAGQVVLVARAGKTPRRAIVDAIGHIGEEKSVGLVLNQAQGTQATDYYGYGTYGSQNGEPDDSR